MLCILAPCKNNSICLRAKTKLTLSTGTRRRTEIENILHEIRLTRPNTKFPQMEGKWRTNTSPNNAKAQIDHILIKKKWTNSTLNCEEYFCFERVSYHKIVSAKIDHILIKKKWINSTLNCEEYFCFEKVSSHQKIVSSKIDHILIKKKWINSTLNYEEYFFFERVSSHHKIVVSKIDHILIKKMDK